MSEQAGWPWHQALVYAVTGERRPDLGRQDRPDLDRVVSEIGDAPRGAHAVPVELTEGIGAAQLAAVLLALRERLPAAPRPVLVDRAPDAAERRLLDEVPPHHGG